MGQARDWKNLFLQATHTTAILENSSSSSTSSCRCVATVPSAQKCGPARKKARRKLRSNSFPSRWPGPSKTLLPVLWTWGRKVGREGRLLDRGGRRGRAVENLSSNRFGTYLSPCQQSFSGFLNEFEWLLANLYYLPSLFSRFSLFIEIQFNSISSK